jgi:hypothetical protein
MPIDVDGITSTALSTAGELHEIYSTASQFEPAERRKADFFTSLPEAKGVVLKGKHWNWRMPLAYGHGTGSPNQDDAWSRSNRRRAVEMQVNHSNFDSTIEITIEAAERATGGDSSYSDIIADQVDEASVVLALREEMMALGPGTGQLATVNATTTNSNTFVCNLADSGIGGSVKLSDGQPIDIATAASAGTVQETTAIASVDITTHTVTMDDALSLTSGWSIFQRGTYGKGVPAGLDYIIDNGSVNASIFNQLRSQSIKLQSFIVGSNTNIQPYSESLIDEGMLKVSLSSEMTVTYLLCNEGVALEHRLYAGKDRVFWYQNAGPMPATTGGKLTGLTYQYNDAAVPFKINKRVAPRALYGVYQPCIQKAFLRRPDWVRTGGAEGYPTLSLKPASDTYSYVLTGSILAQWAMICDMFNANFKVQGIRDRKLAGDPD